MINYTITATGLGITSTGLELLLSLLHDAGKELEVLDLTVLDVTNHNLHTSVLSCYLQPLLREESMEDSKP